MAAVSGPDVNCAHPARIVLLVRARPARIASRVKSLQGSDAYRINDLAKTAQVWRQATIKKNCALDPSGDTRLSGCRWRNALSELRHRENTTLAAVSEADLSAGRKCRLGSAGRKCRLGSAGR